MLHDGLPVYSSWEKIPQGVHTKTQLTGMRLYLPEGVAPVAFKKSTLPLRYYALYDKRDALPMQPKIERQPKDYGEIFVRRYEERRRAYLDACQMCFELNRYAKHRSCTQKHRETIYSLKNAWIKYLYEHGFCVEAVQVKTPERAKECWGCYGDGCGECNYTGVYRVVASREYWHFASRSKDNVLHGISQHP